MNRYDFYYLFEVKDANPNGDPDAGNLPRIDPETGHGLVTDVCLKRKVRNYVTMTKNGSMGYRIYFLERAVLNEIHKEAWAYIGEEPSNKLPKDEEKANQLTQFMCQNFYDIRTFGAVMTTEVNCGQVRGPVQISFARSIDPIVTLEHAITRSSVTNIRDLDKERTMGRKYTVPYALYYAYGFVNPMLAEKTGFSEDDLALLWEALKNAFQFDQSAARPAGSMVVRKLLAFEHASPLGSVPSHELFDAIRVQKKPGVQVPRSFEDYTITIDRDRLPSGITLHEFV